MKPIYLSILCAAFLVGCSHHYDQAQLAGSYVLNVGPGITHLELRLDGTYTRSFQFMTGTGGTQTGKWYLDSIEGCPTVRLDDYRSFSGEEFGQGSYFLPIESFFGEICLMTNEDTNECYEKK